MDEELEMLKIFMIMWCIIISERRGKMIAKEESKREEYEDVDRSKWNQNVKDGVHIGLYKF